MKWLVLLALVLAGCCAHRFVAPVDVDALNAASQARLQAQADRESAPKEQSLEKDIQDLRRDNLERLRKLK